MSINPQYLNEVARTANENRLRETVRKKEEAERQVKQERINHIREHFSVMEPMLTDILGRATTASKEGLFRIRAFDIPAEQITTNIFLARQESVLMVSSYSLSGLSRALFDHLQDEGWKPYVERTNDTASKDSFAIIIQW